MTDTRDIELVQKVSGRLSNVIRQVAAECEATHCNPRASVLDDALHAINHQGLHANWDWIRAMVGVNST